MVHDLIQAAWIALAAATASLVFCRALRRRLTGFRSQETKPGKEKIHRLFPKPRKPMGGGLAMFCAAALALLLLARPLNALLVACLVAVALFGVLGLRDDLRKARGSGISERQKLLWQTLLGLAVAAYLWLAWDYGTVTIPFVPKAVSLGVWYLPLGALVLVAASNAVNLTDGVDGLAAGSMAIACLIYLGFGFILHVPTVSALAAACLGACLGFLVYNYLPARMIMGDAGALALGAALGVMALVSRTEWLLLLVGGVLVIAAESVIIQTTTIRFFRSPVRLLRHRRAEPFRPFLCTPIHHHFQWLGWPERRILALFLALGAGLGVLAWAAYLVKSLWAVGLGDWLWLLGLAAMGAFLAAAAVQKALRGEFFLGLHQPEAGSEPVLAVFQGVPVEILGRPLYRPAHLTSIAGSALPAMAADSLWRSVSEVEADALLGKIHAELKLWDGAVEAWERIPARNLALREDILLQLARIYYARGELFKAIRVWEDIPPGRLEGSERLRGTVRQVKLRLADLASKAHRQSMRHFRQARARPGAEVAGQLREARRLNHDLFALLVREREQLEAPAAPDAASAAPTQRGLFRRMERSVLERIAEIENALAECESLREGAVVPTAGQRPRGPSPTPQPAPAADQATAQACARLGISPQQLTEALGGAGQAPLRLTAVQPLAAQSRNALFRISLDWSGPPTMVVKSYEEERISFFAACYRRERGVLELLGGYGCAVPQVYGGVETGDRALLFMEDAGRQTLADRLTGDEAQRLRLLGPAVDTLVDLHARTREHLPRLQREVLRVEKEALGLEYYLNTLRIALQRVLDLDGETLPAEEWAALADGFRPVAALLAVQPKTFIHFEFTPQHLLASDDRLTAFDFEQATVGPPEFDLATLLRCPEGALSEAAVGELAEAYAARAAAAGGPPIPHRAPEALDYAAIIKDVVYAGAAANFHRKFGGEEHRGRVAWYLGDADGVMARYPDLAGLRAMIQARFARWVSQDAPSP